MLFRLLQSTFPVQLESGRCSSFVSYREDAFPGGGGLHKLLFRNDNYNYYYHGDGQVINTDAFHLSGPCPVDFQYNRGQSLPCLLPWIIQPNGIYRVINPPLQLRIRRMDITRIDCTELVSRTCVLLLVPIDWHDAPSWHLGVSIIVDQQPCV